MNNERTKIRKSTTTSLTYKSHHSSSCPSLLPLISSSSTSSSSPPPLLHPSPSSSTISTTTHTSDACKMARRPCLKPTLATIFIFLAFYAFFNAFLSPIDPSKLESSSSSTLFDPTRYSILGIDASSNSAKSQSGFSNSAKSEGGFSNSAKSEGGFSSLGSNSSPVKVFMYDLPRKFTYGVVESYLIAREALKSGGDDVDLKYPGNQHSGEWFLFADLIREERDGSPVTRVFDPEEADVFYVPFFSSLSLVVNPIRAGGGGEGVYSDEEMQEGLVEWLEGQVYWRRNNGWDHVFICQDPNALYKVVDRVKNGVLLVSDFGRLRSDQGSLIKDVILPYSHRINSFKGEVGVEERKSLLFFMGNRYRKEGGKIRDLLFQVLEGQEDVIIKHGTQSRESRRMATQGMHSSKFCLHPAGDTPSACRLFDAIVSMCIPVIVSDQIELPFEDVIDYQKVAVFVDTETAVKPGYLTKMLRQISTERILEYQQELKEVKRYFEYDDPNGTVNEIWRQVSLKLPLIKLMTHRDKRLVRKELTEPDCACLCSNKTGVVTTF